MSEADALPALGDKRRLAATTSQLAGALWLPASMSRTAIGRAGDQAADELDDFVLLSARFNRANLLHAISASAKRRISLHE
jgi:hypothetical protein